MFAARQGDLPTTELLLARGADIDAVSEEDGSALVIAAAWGHEQLAIRLLEEGADPRVSDANGMTALHYSMREGSNCCSDINWLQKNWCAVFR
jgi:ankyrin repeat protein